jgi:ABC-type uncharacterized transport system permease subunit
VFQITILFLYLLAALAFAHGRLQPQAQRAGPIRVAAFVFAVAAIGMHANGLFQSLTHGGTINVSLVSSVSLIGLLLGVIGCVAALDEDLRGVSAGLILLAAPAGLATRIPQGVDSGEGLSWQLQTHVFSAMLAYGLLAAGAIVAIYALIQDRRLRAARLSSVNRLFAPLDTTERVLHGVTTAGTVILAMSVMLGITFVEDLFAQHLVHKTVLSFIALLIFGVLLAGRYVSGWRGRRAVYLYLGGFVVLCLAYFGSRMILELVLGRSWG